MCYFVLGFDKLAGKQIAVTIMTIGCFTRRNLDHFDDQGGVSQRFKCT